MVERKLTRAYTPIDATKDFNEKEFGQSYGKVGMLENTIKALNNNPNDYNAIEHAGQLTFGNSGFYEQFKFPGKEAINFTSEAFKDGKTAMDSYTIKNSKGLYGILNFDEKKNLTLQSKVLSIGNPEIKNDEGVVDEKKTGFNKEYNTFSGLVGLVQYMNQISVDSKEAESERIGFVAEQSQYSQSWLQRISQKRGKDIEYATAIFNEYAIDANQDLREIITNKEGKEDIDKISKFSDINFRLHNDVDAKDIQYFGGLQMMAYNAYQRRESEAKKKAAEAAK